MIASCLATVDFNSSTVFCNSELALRITGGWYPSLPSDRRTVTKATSCGRRLFRRIHIADVGAVVDTSLPGDSRPNADIAIAGDVRAGKITQGGVADAGGVEIKRECSRSRVSKPVVLFNSASEPVAVLALPVVLPKSSLAPTAVLMEPGPPFGASTGAPLLLLVCPRRVNPWQCTSEKGQESSGRKASCPNPGSRRRRIWIKA
jgi:hypothetical protein